MKLYKVSVTQNQSLGPVKKDVPVIAENPHDALDAALEHSKADSLYDEPIQRELANGKDYNGRHNYDSYLREVEFVDARE